MQNSYRNLFAALAIAAVVTLNLNERVSAATKNAAISTANHAATKSFISDRSNSKLKKMPFRLRQLIQDSRLKDPKLVNFLSAKYGINMVQQDGAGSQPTGKANGISSKITGSNARRTTSSVSSLARPKTPSQTLNSNFWIPNNTVNSVVVDDPNDRVYIGGNFTYVGPFVGPVGKLDAATGIHDPNFPLVTSGSSTGEVDTIVPDGSGGFYIGGYFDHIGNTAVNNMAHIRWDGTVLETFNPNPDDQVETIAFNGPNLIVGGFFSTIGGVSTQYIGEIDTSSGSAVASWNPPLLTGGFFNGVTTVFVYGGKVFLSGYFTTVGDSTRYGAAALDTDSGSVTLWNPNPNDPNDYNFYESFAAVDGWLYIGGINTSSEAPLLFKVDTTYGVQNETWEPQIQLVNNDYGYVDQLKVINGMLCVAGEFSGFGATTQYGFAALDPVSASLSSWKTNVDSATEVNSFDVNGDEIFFSGDFTTIGGAPRAYMAASDTNGNILSWSPNADEAPNGLLYNGGDVYAFGNGYSFNGDVRNSVASFVQSTGALTGFSAGMNGENDQVLALALDDTTLYVGGDFRTVSGQPRNSLAALSTSTGNLLPFDAQLDGPPWTFEIDSYGPVPFVFSLKNYGGKLYVGGMFDASGDSTRNDAAAFDLSNGELTQWNPNILGRGGYLPEVSQPAVYSIAAEGGTIFAGGEFDSAQSIIRIGLVAVDTSAGTLTSWDPDIDNGSYRVDITSLALDGSTLYFGGEFTSVLGNPISNAAAVDTSGNFLPWNPNLNGEPEAITTSGALVYIGGSFSAPYENVCAVDKVNGTAVSDWTLSPDQGISAIGLSYQHQVVYLGGQFQYVLGDFHQYFAAVTNPGDASLPVQATNFIATSDPGSVTLSWTTQSEVNNAGFVVERQRSGITNWQLVGSYTTYKSLAGLGTSSSGRNYSFTDNHVVSGSTYEYKIQSVSTSGVVKDLSTLTVSVDVPKSYALYQNYPNPFNPSTTIRFDLKQASTVSLEIYNTLGQRVDEHAFGSMDAGRYNEVVDMSRFASGVYFYRIIAVAKNGERFSSIKKLVLVK